MKKSPEFEVMEKAFSALPTPMLRRLLWHVEQRTPILCGVDTVKTEFISDAGHG